MLVKNVIVGQKACCTMNSKKGKFIFSKEISCAAELSPKG